MNTNSTTRIVTGTLVLSFAIITSGCGQQPQGPGTGVVSELTATWSKAFDAGDPMALAGLYAENARMLPPGAGAIVGRGDIESYWRGDIGEGGATTTLTPTDSLAFGDFVQIEGTYEVMGEQSTELAGGQYQQLWARTGDGWRVQREMWRTDPLLHRSVQVAEHLTSAWTKAYNAADAKALTVLYDKDAVLSSFAAGSFTGVVAIESFWVRDFGKTKPATTLTLTDVYLAEELAHLEGEYKVDDKGTITDGHYMQLWMRDGNAWRIHREMWWQ
jgi:ketosteroid isomerase-like protein